MNLLELRTKILNALSDAEGVEDMAMINGEPWGLEVLTEDPTGGERRWIITIAEA